LARFADYFSVSVDYLIGSSSIPTKADLISEGQLSSKESILIKNFRSAPAKIQDLIFGLLKEIAKNV